jgi:hypothetical protein
LDTDTNCLRTEAISGVVTVEKHTEMKKEIKMKQFEDAIGRLRIQVEDAKRWAAYCLKRMKQFEDANVSHPSDRVALEAAQKELKALEDELEFALYVHRMTVAAIVLDRQDEERFAAGEE